MISTSSKFVPFCLIPYVLVLGFISSYSFFGLGWWKQKPYHLVVGKLGYKPFWKEHLGTKHTLHTHTHTLWAIKIDKIRNYIWICQVTWGEHHLHKKFPNPLVHLINTWTQWVVHNGNTLNMLALPTRWPHCKIYTWR